MSQQWWSYCIVGVEGSLQCRPACCCQLSGGKSSQLLQGYGEVLVWGWDGVKVWGFEGMVHKMDGDIDLHFIRYVWWFMWLLWSPHTHTLTPSHIHRSCVCGTSRTSCVCRVAIAVSHCFPSPPPPSSSTLTPAPSSLELTKWDPPLPSSPGQHTPTHTTHAHFLLTLTSTLHLQTKAFVIDNFMIA